MAEKKKKFVPFKDLAAPPRRPFILRSERSRETNRSDQDRTRERDKQAEKEREQEKQPTILVKPREASAPKEETRPHTPAPPTHDPDTSTLMPSKIAQNGSKEKKITLESKECTPIPPMLESVKLLDENFEFNQSAAEFLHDSNSNYLVVGILGGQGVGKSTILNLLAQDKLMDDLCSKIIYSHELPSSMMYDDEGTPLEEQMEGIHIAESPQDVKEKAEQYFKFKMQDIEQIERAQHCTKGIDMYVTNDRVVLLDCQALWSPSALEESSATGATPVTVRGSTVATVDCLQLASYLMAVCHVLIVVQDWFVDYNFLRFIQAAEMLKPSLSASSSSSTQESQESAVSVENQPHVLLLQNRCRLEDYTQESVRAMQDLYRKIFENSKLQLNSGMYLYSDTNRNGLNIDPVCKGMTVETCGMPINLFLLPELYEDYDNTEIYRGHPPFISLASRLRSLVYGASRHQLTNVPNLSEKGWLAYCSKAWDTIRKCTFFMEYGRLLP